MAQVVMDLLLQGKALVGFGQEQNGTIPYSSSPTFIQNAGNISGQLQLQEYTNMPSSSSTPKDNTLGADPRHWVAPSNNQQPSSFSEGYRHISAGVQTPVISDSIKPDGGVQTWTLGDAVRQPIRRSIGGPRLEHTIRTVLLQWNRPDVEQSKHWNLLDQLRLLYSSQTKIHSGDFATMRLMPEHYDSVTPYSQGPYQRLFFNDQALFLEKMMRDLQITTIPKEVMQTHRNRGVLIQPLEPDDSDDEPPLKRKLRNKYQLRFVNKVCEAYYTWEQIKADDGNLLNVALYDENNAKITSGPLSSASVEVVVLHGDFNATGQDYWTSEEFSSCVVCPQSRKEPPAVEGDRVLVLVDGQASLGDAFFQKSSIYARTGKFKMGAMLASTPDDRVQEGISEPFWVWNRKGGRTGCTVFQRWHRSINAIIFIRRLQSETYRSRSMRRPLLSRDTGDACLELLKEQQWMQDRLLDAWTSGAEGFGLQLPKAAVMKNVTLLDPRNKGTPYHKMLKKQDILNVQNEEYLPFADVKENDNEDAAEEAHDGNSGKEKMEIVCENTVSLDFKQAKLSNFVPVTRSGDWSDIGGRNFMEVAHVCIPDLAKNFGYNTVDDEIISFYGVFDGHGGKDAAQFVCDNLPRVIVEDADFPLELEKVVRRSFVQTDSQFAEACSHHHALSSGTTALTAMIFGRSLLVANAGDCRAVLSRRGIAIEMSKDHRASCLHERKRVESLGGYVHDGYLNGQVVVTRTLGDWHLEGMKKMGETGGPLSAEPELKMITLTKDDEFLIIGSDGIWDVFSNRNAVNFARRRLQEHNDLILCCKEFVDEAIRRGSTDNLTVVMVSFHQEAPPQIKVNRTAKVERSISAEGLCSLRELLEGQ